MRSSLNLDPENKHLCDRDVILEDVCASQVDNTFDERADEDKDESYILRGADLFYSQGTATAARYAAGCCTEVRGGLSFACRPQGVAKQRVGGVLCLAKSASALSHAHIPDTSSLNCHRLFGTVSDPS